MKCTETKIKYFLIDNIKIENKLEKFNVKQPLTNLKK